MEHKPSLEEMRDALLSLLYERRDELKGIALVQGLKALATMTEQAKSEPEKDEDHKDHSLLDQIHALPPAHAAKLLETEIARLEHELTSHRAALVEMKELA